VYRDCCVIADESDTSLKPEHLLLFVHDVAEGNIGGNPSVLGSGSHRFFRFPSLIPFWIEESHV
jgi:hypothetical protein